MVGWSSADVARLGLSRARSASMFKNRACPAKGNRRTFHKAGEMNKTEAAYAARLEAMKAAGEISDYRFECVKLRLADKTFYTPDFMVLRPDGGFEMHEVKGFWEDDARVKIKVAAESFPFKFVAVRKVKGAWVFEEF